MMSPLPGLIALTRDVSPAMARCELTHLSRMLIDVERVAAQHAEYERALAQLGCAVRRLRTGKNLPDSVFIEDAAIVLDELAVIMRPGAPSRRAEVSAVAEALRRYRSLGRIEPPGTMDGGDVLRVGRTILVGRSSRTNDAGIAQLTRLVAPHGYLVRAIEVRGCLHLKSAATAVADHALLANRAWIVPGDCADRGDKGGTGALEPFEVIDVDPREPGAANVVRVGDRLLSAAAFPRTRERLEARGFSVVTVDVSEIAKAEGAVTCCSLLFTA
jgi:dimethylargininase